MRPVPWTRFKAHAIQQNVPRSGQQQVQGGEGGRPAGVFVFILISFVPLVQAYWDALVAPSINDFCNRVEWLTKSSKMAWVDAQKVIKPLCPIGQSPARPARRRQNKLVS